MRHLVLRRDNAATGHVGLSGQEDEMEFLLRRQLDRFCGEKHGSEREEENGRNDFFMGSTILLAVSEMRFRGVKIA